MTLADIVFPFFLFIVGVSIPLAFERAQAAGVSRWAQLLHILIRTAGLLLLGVIELNSEQDRSLPRNLWATLAFTPCCWRGASFPANGGRGGTC